MQSSRCRGLSVWVVVSGPIGAGVRVCHLFLTIKYADQAASDKPPATGPISDQVTGQVISVCTALGVPKEHAELVMRVMAACTGSAQAEGCECE